MCRISEREWPRQAPMMPGCDGSSRTWFYSLPTGKMASNIREGFIEKSAPRGNAMKRRALCIGINDSPGTDSDLAGCANDANHWAAAFTDRGFAGETLLDRPGA